MNKSPGVIYLILVWVLNCSCVDKEPAEDEPYNSSFDTTQKTNSLKFTSGVRAILRDSKGSYWFGSHKEGVSVFDGETFRYYTIDDGLPENQIRSIQEDASGVIWIATASGICSYDGGKLTNHTGMTKVATHFKWEKAEDDLWFTAGNQNGVYRYDGDELTYLAFPQHVVVDPKKVYHVTGITEGKKNMLWVGTYAGVIGYNGREFSTINDETLKKTSETGSLHIRSIFEDSKGRLWIGNNGIGVLLKVGDRVINFSEKMNLINPESSGKGHKSPAGTLEHVFVIQEDGSGNIWFGDRDTGIWRYDGDAMTNYTVDTKLSSQMAWCINNDDDNLLFGMADGGVYKFNGKSFDKIF